MADIETTKRNGGPVQRPIDLFSALQSEMDRVFDRFQHGLPGLAGAFAQEPGRRSNMVPELDVHEDAKQLRVEAELPGVDEKDVTLTLNSGVLTISGEKRNESEKTEGNYHIAERSFGAFRRSLRLPDTIDENTLEAKFEKGVLVVSAQKRPEAVKAEKKIEIKNG